MIEFGEQFLETMMTERAIAVNTLSSYRKDIFDLESFLLDKSLSPLQVSKIHISEYIRFLSYKNLSPRTIHRKLSTVRSYYAFLTLEGYISHNPTLTIELPKQRIKLPSILSVEEISQLISSIESCDSKESIRLYAMISLLYASGLRVSELVGLKCSDVIGINGSVKKIFSITGKGDKQRYVVINDLAMSAIEKYLKSRDDFVLKNSATTRNYLFPSKSKAGYMTRQNFGILLKRAALVAGLDPDRVSPHILRHCFASHLLAKGIGLRVIQELLGHVDIGTTQIYTHLQLDHLKEAIESCHPLSQNFIKNEPL